MPWFPACIGTSPDSLPEIVWPFGWKAQVTGWTNKEHITVSLQCQASKLNSYHIVTLCVMCWQTIIWGLFYCTYIFSMFLKFLVLKCQKWDTRWKSEGVNICVKSGSVWKAKRWIQHNFQDDTVPSNKTVHTIINKLRKMYRLSSYRHCH